MSDTHDRPASAARAFTLVELLVVLGILSLLLGLLMPAVAAVRRSANHTVCRAELRQIGAMLQMYLTDSNGRLPRVNPIPSVRPRINSGPSLPDLLRPYGGRAKAAFRCPADRITWVEPAAPAGYDTYFDREQSSYQYNPLLSAKYARKKFEQTPFARRKLLYLLPVVWDYEPFHGRPNKAGSTNYLFADMHVGDLADYGF